jgi:hypothetical protein
MQEEAEVAAEEVEVAMMKASVALDGLVKGLLKYDGVV